MSTTNAPTTENAMVLTPRQEKLLALRDDMAPGAKPGAIVPRTFAEAQQMCQALSRSGLVPRQYAERPEDLVVTIMSGAEIGIPPMAAIRLYHIMDGIPRLSSEGVRAVLLSHPEIEYFEVSSCSDTQATWIGKRRGRPEKSATWTVDRAKRAGLWDRKNRDGSPGNWQKYPEDMLNARASMQLGRMLAPDIVAGMVSREEAMDGDFIDASFTEAKPAFVAPPIRPDTGHRFTYVSEANASVAITNPPVASNEIRMGPPPGVPQAPAAEAPPKRGPGRPPKDKPADPTPPQSSSAGSSAPVTSLATSPTVSAASTTAESPPSKLDAAVREVEEKIAARQDPTPPGSTTAPSPSAGSAPPSTSASGADSVPAGDDFGADDPVDAAPAQPTMADFHAWLASCKTQRDMSTGLGRWRDWSKYMCDVLKDDSFRKTGASTIAMQDAYSKRKGEVPA